MSVTNAMTARKDLRTYDHTEFYPTVRTTDVFLCTYPKSGTTWLGYMIAQFLKQDPAEQLDLKTFNRYVPDVNFNYTKRGSLREYSDFLDPRFFLCHATYDPNLPRVVYVLRDPRDVMLSYWHYKKFLSKDFAQSLAEYLQSGNHWPCEWDQHVSSWLLPQNHPNLLVVRYEAMQIDAAGVLRQVLEFAGVDCHQDKLLAAVEASRFNRMRSAEEQFGVHGKAGDPGERFVRKGKSGSWRQEMSECEIQILQERYGQTMQALGYELAG
jgi:hypothetical protein